MTLAPVAASSARAREADSTSSPRSGGLAAPSSGSPRPVASTVPSALRATARPATAKDSETFTAAMWGPTKPTCGSRRSSSSRESGCSLPPLMTISRTSASASSSSVISRTTPYLSPNSSRSGASTAASASAWQPKAARSRIRSARPSRAVSVRAWAVRKLSSPCNHAMRGGAFGPRLDADEAAAMDRVPAPPRGWRPAGPLRARMRPRPDRLMTMPALARSRLAVGSSASTRAGRCTSAPPTATRCRCPSERSEGQAPRCALDAEVAATESTSPSSALPLSASGRAMLPRTRRKPRSLPSCGT